MRPERGSTASVYVTPCWSRSCASTGCGLRVMMMKLGWAAAQELPEARRGDDQREQQERLDQREGDGVASGPVALAGLGGAPGGGSQAEDGGDDARVEQRQADAQ